MDQRLSPISLRREIPGLDINLLRYLPVDYFENNMLNNPLAAQQGGPSPKGHSIC